MFLFKSKKKIRASARPSNKKTKYIIQKNKIDNTNLEPETHFINTEYEKYLPRHDKDIIYPKNKSWELPNRKTFYNWINENFDKYELGNEKKQTKYHPRLKEYFELSNIQRLTRDYLQGTSPVRGLLLFLGLGVGKTCTALTISEAILTKKEVIVISKANLENNWIKEIKNCGADYVRNNNHWVFHHCDTPEMQHLASEIGIPKSVIRANGGMFLVDFTNKDSNFTDLNTIERDKLDLQINTMLDERFTFIHSDDTRGLWNKIKPNSFDNKIIIIDEVHNIGNIMASKSKSAEMWYNQFMNAVNPKIIFLSGTPIVNRIFEITKIYNILRGYMNVLEIKFKATFDTSIDYDKLKYAIKNNTSTDQIIINKAKKMIKITKTPDYFINSADNKGVVYNPTLAIDNDTFKEQISKIVQTMGYKASLEWTKKTVFPEDEETFEQYFYNRDLNKLKRIDIIKRRIAGLTSYYEYQDKTNYPKLLNERIVSVPMSEYQFGNYERYRHQEILDDRGKFRKANIDNDDAPSTYRIKSRFACSFVFPEETGSPYDMKTLDDKIEHIEELNDRLSNFNLRVSDVEVMKAAKLRTQIYAGFLQLLEKDKAKYLDIKNGSLAKYSPKYLTMLLNIQKQAPNGKIFVYSQFNSLVGLNTFALSLDQTGEWAPFTLKRVNKMWELDNRDEYKGKYRYMYYTGDEDKVERDIMIKIMNSDWHLLGSDCENLVKQVKKMHTNNYYGEVIKMILTTRTGAEGLDLREIRYIHIMEPYWQPVLIKQVIGRGVRNKSHLKLALEDRNVEVFIYMATITPNLVRKITHVDIRNDTYKYPNPALADKTNKVVSSDEYLYLTSERKRFIVNEFQKIMKESAFDCTLNYKENKLNPDNKSLVCIDYNVKNRDDYLYTPGLEDTIEGYDAGQDKLVAIQYKTIKAKDGTIYYYELTPNAEGKMYIYDEELKDRARIPKPVGEVKIVNGKREFVIKKKKKAKSNEKSKSKSKRKSKSK